MVQTKVYHGTDSSLSIQGRAARILELCERGEIADARRLLVESEVPEMLLARGVVYYWLARAGSEFTIEEAKNLLTKAERSGADPLLCQVFVGLCYWRQDQADEALIMFSRVAKSPDPRIRFLALLSRNQIEGDKHNWRKCLETLEEMAEILDSQSDCNKGKFFNQRANAFYRAFEEIGGDYRDRASIDYEEARHFFEISGSARHEGTALNNIAYLYRIHDTKQALEYADRAISLFERIGDRASLGSAKDTKAQIFFFADDLQQALKWANDSVRLLMAIDDTVWLPTSYITRGTIYKQLGRNDEAIADFQLAAEVADVNKIRDALIKTSGRVTPAAKLLGKRHSTLNFLIEKHPELKALAPRRKTWKRRKRIL